MTWTLIAQIVVLVLILLGTAIVVTLLVSFIRTGMPKSGPDRTAIQEHLPSLALPSREQISQEARTRYGHGADYQRFSEGASWVVRFVRDQAEHVR